MEIFWNSFHIYFFEKGWRYWTISDAFCQCPQNEKDISVRQKAVDMLYAMCNKTNVAQIVFEMLTYLEVADYSMREEMVRNYGFNYNEHDY